MITLDSMLTKHDLTASPPFGRLTVVSRGPDYVYGTGRRTPQWWCLCSCGHTPPKLVRQGILLSGHTRSCGCLRKEELQRMRGRIHEDLALKEYRKHAKKEQKYLSGVLTPVV